MKSLAILLLSTVLCFFAGNAHSQAPQLTGTVLSNLQGIEASNKALIESQTKTLELLDQLQQTSQQLKQFGQRS